MWVAVKTDATAKTELHQIDTLEELVELRGKLIGMGATVEDAQFRSIILSSLPPSYRPIISAITVSSSLTGSQIDNDRLIRIITEEAEHRSILDNSVGAGSALLATETWK